MDSTVTTNYKVTWQAKGCVIFTFPLKLFHFNSFEVGRDTISACNLIEKIESWDIKLIDNVLRIYLM